MSSNQLSPVLSDIDSNQVVIRKENDNGESTDELNQWNEEKTDIWTEVESKSSGLEPFVEDEDVEILFLEDSPEPTESDAINTYSKLYKLSHLKPQSDGNPDSIQVENKELYSKGHRKKSGSAGKNSKRLVEQVACFKCKFCLFLSLSQDAVAAHVQREHASQVPNELNSTLQCPGCSNVFFSLKSLRVHLSEDHNVAAEELENILSTFKACDTIQETPQNSSKGSLNKDEQQSSAGNVKKDVQESSPSAESHQTYSIEEKSSKAQQIKLNRILPRNALITQANQSARKHDLKIPAALRSPVPDETGKIRVRKMSSLEKSLQKYNSSSLPDDIHSHDNQPDHSDGHDEDIHMDIQYDIDSMQILDIPIDQQTTYCEAIIDEICHEEVLENVMYVEEADITGDRNSPLMVCFAASPDPTSGNEEEYDDDNSTAISKLRKDSGSTERVILSSCTLDSSGIVGANGKRLVKRGFVKKSPQKKGKNVRTKKAKTLKRKRTNSESNDEPTIASYKCSIYGCTVRLISQENLEYHQRCHISNEIPENTMRVSSGENLNPGEKRGRILYSKRTFTCPECSSEVHTWKQMKSHLWKTHSIDMELYSCAHCDYKTPSLSNLNNVHIKIHGAERPFLCDTCGKGFKTTKQLRNHKVVHARKETVVETCETCGRSFSSNRLLRNHINTVHNKVRPYMCSECGHTAANRSSLKMHLRQHTGDRPYGCDQCEYRTSDHNSLRRHKKRHTGDKPYKCPYCTYACIQSTTFIGHLRNKHPDQDSNLMFSCKKCPFNTVNHDIYLSHVAEHDLAEACGIPYKPASVPSQRRKPKHGKRADESSAEEIPIFVSIATDEAVEESEQPNFENIVQHVSEAIVPGSNLHVLYNSISLSDSNLKDPIIQVVDDDSELELVGEVSTASEILEMPSELEFKLHDKKMQI